MILIKPSTRILEHFQSEAVYDTLDTLACYWRIFRPAQERVPAKSLAKLTKSLEVAFITIAFINCRIRKSNLGESNIGGSYMSRIILCQLGWRLVLKCKYIGQ